MTFVYAETTGSVNGPQIQAGAAIPDSPGTAETSMFEGRDE